MYCSISKLGAAQSPKEYRLEIQYQKPGFKNEVTQNFLDINMYLEITFSFCFLSSSIKSIYANVKTLNRKVESFGKRNALKVPAQAEFIHITSSLNSSQKLTLFKTKDDSGE